MSMAARPMLRGPRGSWRRSQEVTHCGAMSTRCLGGWSVRDHVSRAQASRSESLVQVDARCLRHSRDDVGALRLLLAGFPAPDRGVRDADPLAQLGPGQPGMLPRRRHVARPIAHAQEGTPIRGASGMAQLAPLDVRLPFGPLHIRNGRACDDDMASTDRLSYDAFAIVITCL